MLSAEQTKLAWEEWLAAEIRASYFADLCGTFNRHHRVATWGILLLSSGAAVGLLGRLDWLPAWASPLLVLCVAALSLYSLMAQNPKSAAECSDLHARWNKVGMEYRDLWMNWYAEDAAARLARLNERSAETSKSGTAYRYEPERMEKWQDMVVANRVRPPAA